MIVHGTKSISEESWINWSLLTGQDRTDEKISMTLDYQGYRFSGNYGLEYVRNYMIRITPTKVLITQRCGLDI